MGRDEARWGEMRRDEARVSSVMAAACCARRHRFLVYEPPVPTWFWTRCTRPFIDCRETLSEGTRFPTRLASVCSDCLSVLCSHPIAHRTRGRLVLETYRDSILYALYLHYLNSGLSGKVADLDFQRRNTAHACTDVRPPGATFTVRYS